MNPVHRTDPGEPSIVSALGRVLEAGQRIIIDRIDLAWLDLLMVLTRTRQGAVLVFVGVIPMFIGWLALTATAVILLDAHLTRPAGLALVGAINIVAGGLLIALGVQRVQEDSARRASETKRVMAPTE